MVCVDGVDTLMTLKAVTSSLGQVGSTKLISGANFLS